MAGQQPQRPAEGPGPSRDQQARQDVGHQPDVRRPDQARAALVFRDVPALLHGKHGGLDLPQQERGRHHQVDVRSRQRTGRGEQPDEERQPPHDVAGLAPEQGVRLVGRAADLSTL